MQMTDWQRQLYTRTQVWLDAQCLNQSTRAIDHSSKSLDHVTCSSVDDISVTAEDT